MPALLVIVGIVHARSVGYWEPITTKQFNRYPVSTIYQLRSLVDGPYGWVVVGKRLREIFGPQSTVSIAVSPAGAMPYYAQLRTVDMHGLADAEIARNGRREPHRMVGHQVLATLRQLEAKKVNLVLGHGQVFGDPLTKSARAGNWLHQFFTRDPDYQEVKDRTRALLVPVGKDAWLVTWYLTPSAEVDALIRKNGWPVVPMNELPDFGPRNYSRVSAN